MRLLQNEISKSKAFSLILALSLLAVLSIGLASLMKNSLSGIETVKQKKDSSQLRLTQLSELERIQRSLLDGIQTDIQLAEKGGPIRSLRDKVRNIAENHKDPHSQITVVFIGEGLDSDFRLGQFTNDPNFRPKLLRIESRSLDENTHTISYVSKQLSFNKLRLNSFALLITNQDSIPVSFGSNTLDNKAGVFFTPELQQQAINCKNDSSRCPSSPFLRFDPKDEFRASNIFSTNLPYDSFKNPQIVEQNYDKTFFDKGVREEASKLDLASVFNDVASKAETTFQLSPKAGEMQVSLEENGSGSCEMHLTQSCIVKTAVSATNTESGIKASSGCTDTTESHTLNPGSVISFDGNTRLVSPHPDSQAYSTACEKVTFAMTKGDFYFGASLKASENNSKNMALFLNKGSNAIIDTNTRLLNGKTIGGIIGNDSNYVGNDGSNVSLDLNISVISNSENSNFKISPDVIYRKEGDGLSNLGILKTRGIIATNKVFNTRTLLKDGRHHGFESYVAEYPQEILEPGKSPVGLESEVSDSWVANPMGTSFQSSNLVGDLGLDEIDDTTPSKDIGRQSLKKR